MILQASKGPAAELKKVSEEQRLAGIPVARNLAGLLLAIPRSVIGAAFDLMGPLDLEALRQSQLMLIQRHEALRTVYKPQGQGRPMLMMVQPAPEPFLHLTEREASDEAEARQMVSAAFSEDFDIESGPLMRMQVCCLRMTDFLDLWRTGGCHQPHGCWVLAELCNDEHCRASRKSMLISHEDMSLG